MWVYKLEITASVCMMAVEEHFLVLLKVNSIHHACFLTNGQAGQGQQTLLIMGQHSLNEKVLVFAP